eukprot:scaffold153_cov347-Pavlova_lutheri.AAC.33
MRAGRRRRLDEPHVRGRNQQQPRRKARGTGTKRRIAIGDKRSRTMKKRILFARRTGRCDDRVA